MAGTTASKASRLAAAVLLHGLTVKEAFAGYAADCGSPRVMAITDLRSFGLLARPSLVGPGRDDHDLLWET